MKKLIASDMMSIFEVYESKERAVYPKSEFINECWKILQESEERDEDWIEIGEKAPTREVLLNILMKRTALTNPLWKKALMKGLGYKSIKDLMGDESD